MSNYGQDKAPVAPIVMPKVESSIEMSPTIGALSAALAKTQGEMGGALKEATNPHLKNRYADLQSAWEAWRVCGPKNGLALVQLPGTVSDGVTVTVTIVTMLSHASGEWIRSTLAMPVKAERGRSDAQALGSAVTYGRRYGMMAVTGLVAEDDDGNAATGADRRYQNEPPPREQPRSQSANSNAPAGDSVELADVRRMIANAKGSADMDRAKEYIQSKMPVGHPDRGAAVSEWTNRDRAMAAAAKGAA